MVGRSKKKHNRRIDAAIAALGKGGLGPGFPQDVVRKTINTLLKVYGGDDGWAFIEENSYLLVIETILENQEKGEKGGDDAGALEAVEQLVEDGEPSSHLTLPAEDEPSMLLCVADSEQQHPLVLADGEGSSLVPVLTDVNWRDTSCTDPDVRRPQPSYSGPDCPRESAVLVLADGEGSSLVPVLTDVNRRDTSCTDADVRQPQPSYPGPECPRESAVPGRKRREPAYGWISESESEEDDPVKKESEEDTQLSNTRKRRTAWDVIPHGM